MHLALASRHGLQSCWMPFYSFLMKRQEEHSHTPAQNISPAFIHVQHFLAHSPAKPGSGTALPPWSSSTSPAPKPPLLLITAQNAIPQLQITALSSYLPCSFENQHQPQAHLRTPSAKLLSLQDGMAPTKGF